MDQYKVVGRIGEGAHGLVLRGQHLATGQEVALKKVLLKKLEDGIPSTVIREIKALQEVDCEYVRIKSNLVICLFVPVCCPVLRILDSKWHLAPLFSDNLYFSLSN
jgi:serine/threonine protein kinase